MQGVLLVNLGTPDAPDAGAVRRYLAEFLDDPRVLDMNPLGRKLLLHLVILPFRPAKSAAAYRKIWSEAGSPLLFHSRDLEAALQAELGQDYVVALGMRYGNPSLQSALDKLVAAGIDRILVAPLYPQYASSSTGSTVEHLYRVAGAHPAVPLLQVLPEFYEEPDFIASVAEVAAPALAEFGADHVLFSYHGLPERQVKATQIPASADHCLASPTCCDEITPVNRRCYRAQSHASTRALARALALPEGGWSLSFQSRLGRIPWIRPYTDEVVPELARQGKRRLAVLCPSFVADCLETTEEIGMRARADFLAAGGEELVQIPCVNSHPAWVQGLSRLIRRQLGRLPEGPDSARPLS